LEIIFASKTESIRSQINSTSNRNYVFSLDKLVEILVDACVLDLRVKLGSLYSRRRVYSD